MVLPVVGGVVVPLRRAATPRQTMASSCSCTFCWGLSAYSSVQKITTGRSSLMFVIYRQLSPQSYIHLIRRGGLGKWEGSIWSLLSSKDVTKDHHFIPGMTLLRRYRSTVKIKSHHFSALLPCFPAIPSLCLSFLYALGPRLCLALVSHRFPANAWDSLRYKT